MPQVCRRSYQVEEFTNADIASVRELCARYADLTTFDVADASCMMLAEKYNSFDILTTDTTDFRAVTGSAASGAGSRRYFRLLPYDL